VRHGQKKSKIEVRQIKNWNAQKISKIKWIDSGIGTSIRKCKEIRDNSDSLSRRAIYMHWVLPCNTRFEKFYGGREATPTPITPLLRLHLNWGVADNNIHFVTKDSWLVIPCNVLREYFTGCESQLTASWRQCLRVQKCTKSVSLHRNRQEFNLLCTNSHYSVASFRFNDLSHIYRPHWEQFRAILPDLTGQQHLVYWQEQSPRKCRFSSHISWRIIPSSADIHTKFPYCAPRSLLFVEKAQFCQLESVSCL